MAGSSSVISLVPPGQQKPDIDTEMEAFMTEVKMVQLDAEKLSPKDQIGRLHRPGAKYFNMNPYEVLGLDHKASKEEVNKAYRRMSVQVHPDKNPDNPLAQSAFEMVKNAHERLSEDDRIAFCQRICSAAEEAVRSRVAKDKKKLKKEGQDDAVPEDDPNKMSLSVKIMISRMFAEFEQRKRQLEKQDTEARKKAKEEQAENEFMEALAKREQKMWEKSRQKRVAGWRSWSGQGGAKPKIPNKVKEERRPDGSGYNTFNDDRGEDYKKEWR